jgi:hypothetical protein
MKTMSVTIISKTGIRSLSVDDYRAAMPCAGGFENAEHLPFPKSMSLAPQIHEMGIKLGDNIVGREGDKEGTWWSEKRLTLLWVGQTATVFWVATRNKSLPKWNEVGEAANWTLDSRKWFLANIVHEPHL